MVIAVSISRRTAKYLITFKNRLDENIATSLWHRDKKDIKIE